MFEKKKMKHLFPLIVAMAILALLLIIVEIFTSYDGTDTEDKLDNGKININALVINEIMTSNKGALADKDGNTYDWIELYNGTSKDIDLTGYGLSDEQSGNTKWLFPNVTIKSKDYLIVYLSGSNKDGLYANFALDKAGGETLTLKKKSGKVVDSVKTKSLAKNNVMARNSSGKWIETADMTPGFANNDEGRKAFLEKRTLTNDDPLSITEFLPRNDGNISFDGHLYSYIEIQNTGKESVSLKNYFVSNDLNMPYQYRLPDVMLKPNETYLIYTSNLGHDNHANFTLKSKNGVVILAHGADIIEEVEYTDVPNGSAYIKTSGGDFMESVNITPGYPNTPEGMENFTNYERKNPTDLIISELMNANTKYLAQNGGEYYDWIELYNNSGKTINLADYALSTDTGNKKMYVLPKKELKSGEYYVLMASGDTALSNSKYAHANFKISESESIFLYKGNDLIDSVAISNIPRGYSYGRSNVKGFYYYATPTPGAKNNNSGILEIAYEPVFVTTPGVYNNVSNVSVTLKGEGTIYYTLDGSTPTTKSKVYNSPIILKKTTVVKAISYASKKKASAVTTGSYIINENHTLPVLSVSLPPTSFKSVSSRTSASGYVVAAHAELYEKDKSFSVDCGLKLFGGSTRYMAKKSFTLKFSKKYGPSTLNYKVFDNRDAVKYDSLVIRSGSQDSTGTMIRDELATSLMNDYGTVDVQAYKGVILYINGEYWGIYFIREKVDEEFVRHHYDVPEEGTNIVRIDNQVSAGSSKDYRSLVNYVKSHDMSVASNYDYVTKKLDIDNFIDYWIGAMYTTNNDIVNTRFFNNPNLDGGRIKMVFYDFDYAFYNTDRNYMQWMTASNGLSAYTWSYDNSLLRNLLKNKTFKKRFLERASYNYKNLWNKNVVMKRYNELINLIKPEISRNQKRWNNTMKDWESECKTLKNYINNRDTYFVNHIKSYFGLSSKEVKEYFGT